MAKYVKCPHCELNYILADEKRCVVCKPQMHGKTLADYEAANDAYRYAKMKAREAQRQSMEAFRAYRFNRKPNY